VYTRSCASLTSFLREANCARRSRPAGVIFGRDGFLGLGGGSTSFGFSSGFFCGERGSCKGRDGTFLPGFALGITSDDADMVKRFLLSEPAKTSAFEPELFNFREQASGGGVVGRYRFCLALCWCCGTLRGTPLELQSLSCQVSFSISEAINFEDFAIRPVVQVRLVLHIAQRPRYMQQETEGTTE